MKLEAGIKCSHKRDQISSNLFQISYNTQAGTMFSTYPGRLDRNCI